MIRLVHGPVVPALKEEVATGGRRVRRRPAVAKSRAVHAQQLITCGVVAVDRPDFAQQLITCGVVAVIEASADVSRRTTI
jgi:hypothetical protein